MTSHVSNPTFYAKLTDDALADRLPSGLTHVVREKRAGRARLEGSLRPARLTQLAVYRRRETDALSRRLDPAMARLVEAARRRLEADARLLDTMSYKAVLSRGYAVLRDEAGSPVTSAGTLSPGQSVEAELKDGRKTLVVAEGTSHSEHKPRPSSKTRKPRRTSDQRQGSLL